MPDAIDRWPAGTVDILLAVDIVKIAALGPDILGREPVGMMVRAGQSCVEFHLANWWVFMR